LDFANHPIEAVPKLIHEGTLSADNPILAFVGFLVTGEFTHGNMPWSEFVGTMEAGHFREIIELLGALGDLSSRNAYTIALANKICAVDAGIEGDLLADILFLYGITINANGTTDEALGALISARNVYESTKATDKLALCCLQIADVYLELDRPDKALPYSKQAREYWEHTEHAEKVAMHYLANAQAYAERGSTSEAMDLFESARLMFEREAVWGRVAECYHDMADLYRRSGYLEKAQQNDEQYQHAMDKHRRQVRDLSRADRTPEQEQFLQEMTRGSEAVIPFMEGLRDDLLQTVRGRSPNPPVDLDLGPKHSDITFDLYYDLIDIYLGHKNFEGALELLERLKGQSLKTMLHQKLEASVSGEDQGSTILRENERTLNYKDIVSLVETEKLRTALVYLFPMEDKTVVFIVRRDTRLSDHTVIIDDYTFDHLRDHADGLSQRDPSVDVKDFKEYLDSVLRQLHSKIFEPIRPYLHGIEKIVFVPYSGFHLLPLHALFTERGGQRHYLMDRYRRISYAPSAGVLAQCRARDKPLRDPEAVVALANPTNNLLPTAEYEAHTIGSLFRTKYMPRASKVDILKAARDANIFHYLGHADGDALHLHADSGVGEEKYATEDIFLSLSLPEAPLVTLSACKTGKVSLGKTDEYIGLPSAFLYAGAATVICSLWPVHDSSTTLLMCKMYEYMKKGWGKAESLRKAQQWLKDQDKAEEHESMLGKLKDSIETRREAKKAPATRFTAIEDDSVLAVEDDQEGLPQDLQHPYYWAGFIASGAD